LRVATGIWPAAKCYRLAACAPQSLRLPISPD
jgi:hypothetical protein